jgi:hypothetical protein
MKSGSSRRPADRHDLGRLVRVQALPRHQEQQFSISHRQPAKSGANGLSLPVDLGVVASGNSRYLLAKALA